MRRAALLLVCLVHLLSAAPVKGEAGIHVVSAGESLGALAQRYGVSIAELQAWNELGSDTIRVGQELTVEAPELLLYTVVPGDTLTCIASRYEVDLDQLLTDNPEVSRRRLGVGETLRIRGGTDPLAGERDGAGEELVTHRVARGETLTRIASEHEVSVRDLAARNAGVDPDHLYREARRRGATASQLSDWFQYARGRWHHDGRIRHFPNHHDHLHVRFACAESEGRCR